MMKPLFLFAPLVLAACATVPEPSDGLVWVKLGQTVNVDGPRVRPLEVLEDSRCPANARCVWAGRVQIAADVTLGSGTQRRELTLGQPQQVADGTLELVEVRPVTTTQDTIRPKDYRFGLRFMGGL